MVPAWALKKLVETLDSYIPSLLVHDRCSDADGDVVLDSGRGTVITGRERVLQGSEAAESSAGSGAPPGNVDTRLGISRQTPD